MKKIIITTVAFNMLQFSLFCQEEKTIKKIKLEDVSIQATVNFENPKTGSFEDFQKLSFNSSILDKYDPSLESLKSLIFNTETNPYLTFAFGIKMNPSKNSFFKSPTLRFGLSSYNQQNLYYNSSINTKSSTETLQSINNPNAFYTIDTTNVDGLTMKQNSKMINLSASINFRTDTERKFSFYTGLGASFGISTKSTTEISRIKTNDITIGKTDFHSWIDPTEDNSSYELIENKNNISTSIFVPIGFEFRLSKEKKIFKHFRFSFEMKHNFSSTTIPELGRSINKYSLVHGVGIRYTF